MGDAMRIANYKLLGKALLNMGCSKIKCTQSLDYTFYESALSRPENKWSVGS